MVDEVNILIYIITKPKLKMKPTELTIKPTETFFSRTVKCSSSFKPALIAVLLSGLLFTGCSKDDDDDKQSKTELLTSSTWKFSNAGIDADNNGTIDSPLPDGTLDDCSKDDTFVFNTGGTGTADEGPTKCDPSDPQSVNFGWALSNNEQDLTLTGFDFGGLDANFKIRTLTTTKLAISQTVEIGLPVPITIVMEFNH